MLNKIACFFGFHDWHFADDYVPGLKSSEQWYWHLERCIRCYREASALNGHCACKEK